jgi:hypothetical protein
MMERYVTAKIEFVNNNNSDNGGTQQKLKHRWGVTTKLKKKKQLNCPNHSCQPN